MRGRWSRYARKGALGLTGLWLYLNLVAWGFFGSYADVGAGLRLSGFLLCGVLLSLGPVLLAAPPVTLRGEMKWGAPLSPARALPLFCWLGALVWFSDVPLHAPLMPADAEVLAVAAPLLLLLILTLSAPLLGLLAWGLQAVVGLFLQRR